MSLGQSCSANIVWDGCRERQFAATALQLLKHSDRDALAAELQARWSLGRIVALMASDDDDTVKVACACLAVVGTFAQCPVLAAALHHDDAVVVTVAEHALWRIWFRSGPRQACRDMERASRLIALSRYGEAVDLLGRIVDAAPDFAEAYNQRAMASCLTDRYGESIADYRQSVRLNPTHFAALAGLGHCLAHLGQYRSALATYRAALNIHPRMDGIRQSINQIRSILSLTASSAVEPSTP
jgi:tetratricopeptide (TPR) repeat protein